MISSPDRWTSILADFSSSRLTIGRFCQRRGLAVSTFHHWRRHLRDPGESTSHDVSFIEAVVTESRPELLRPADPIVELRCGRRVAVPRAFDGDDLVRLVRLLESLDAGPDSDREARP